MQASINDCGTWVGKEWGEEKGGGGRRGGGGGGGRGGEGGGGGGGGKGGGFSQLKNNLYTYSTFCCACRSENVMSSPKLRFCSFDASSASIQTETVILQSHTTPLLFGGSITVLWALHSQWKSWPWMNMTFNVSPTFLQIFDAIIVQVLFK